MGELRWLTAGLCLCGAIGSPAAWADPAQDFMLHCMGCHGAAAQGVSGKVPALATTLTQFMRTPAGRNYVLRVPGASNSMLSDARLAEVLNWIAARFGAARVGSEVAWFTAEEVAASRRTPLVAVQAARREVVRELAATGPAPSLGY